MIDESAVYAVVDAIDFGFASSAKRGRRHEWPYVPVIVRAGYSHQILGRAYSTREEAIARADLAIAHSREVIAKRMFDPRERALREHHGLPREI